MSLAAKLSFASPVSEIVETLPSLHESRLEDLQNTLVSLGEKPFRAKQIFQWLYEKKVSSWDLMTDLSKSLREKLSSLYTLGSLQERKRETSEDEQTVKFLFELSDGKFIEAVLIYAPDRRTVCVSSQVGCNAKCAFCASGKQGWLRNLSHGEIFEQVYLINQFLHTQGERVSHVVFMGMGEPLENYDSVIQAIHSINDPIRLGISQRRITVSTVGVIEGIQKFGLEDLSVNLVLSLHAPNQHIRKKIIPYARKYPLEEILMAMREFARISHRDITYEYTLLAGINDALEHAEELANLLQGQKCTVNLIPYNPIPGMNLKRPEKEQIAAFKEILEEAGITTTWRYTKGKDIAAACGQLALHEKNS